ncbi:MAG: hypothetical protein JST92_09740 [Deltaproteobacteria bacterium]|nr:hypothetical protein [Deltaproteobacteria bacterium]
MTAARARLAFVGLLAGATLSGCAHSDTNGAAASSATSGTAAAATSTPAAAAATPPAAGQSQSPAASAGDTRPPAPIDAPKPPPAPGSTPAPITQAAPSSTPSRYTVADNGIRCIRAPCPSLTATDTKSGARFNVSGVDLSKLTLSPEQRTLLRSQVMDGGRAVTAIIVPAPDVRGTSSVMMLQAVSAE